MHNLRKRFAEFPGERTRFMQEKVSWVMRDETARGLEAWVQSHSNINRDKLSLCVASLFCEIIRAAKAKDSARASDLACGGILLLDQFHINGNLELAWNLTLLEEPPSLRVHRDRPKVAAAAKSSARGARRFSALVEPRVTAAALSEWKNYEGMAKLDQEA